ncbi:hypothetical protein COCNU_03G007680 [Cocos nucifera]|uniref:Uncharacterized protein n=1 Tax=Cocos nucifera TaxID=13894 RepID=A0A8K0MYR0_COCNU|nr:hypothetical protein COCNU_03G007680 [Cocos nucifera]
MPLVSPPSSHEKGKGFCWAATEGDLSSNLTGRTQILAGPPPSRERLHCCRSSSIPATLPSPAAPASIVASSPSSTLALLHPHALTFFLAPSPPRFHSCRPLSIPPPRRIQDFNWFFGLFASRNIVKQLVVVADE